MKISGRVLAFLAFMNLGLYFNVRIWVLPTAPVGTHWWITFLIFGFAFQFNWIALMVGALHEWFVVHPQRRPTKR